jgi:PmbA protein
MRDVDGKLFDAARGAGADAVELATEISRLGFSRFAGSRFTQSGEVVSPRRRVRATLGGARGGVMTSAAMPELLDAARQAAEIAAALPAEPPPWPGVSRHVHPLAPPTALPLDAEARAALAERLFTRLAGHGLQAAGCLKVWHRERAVVTSAGGSCASQDARFQLELIATGPDDASGYASCAGADLDVLDAEALADEAARVALRNRKASALAPGAYDVVLAPAAVAEMIDWLVMTSFSARTVLESASLLCAHERGAPICDPRIDLVEDPFTTDPRLARTPFDSEGSPRRRVALIDRGKAGEPLTDRASAARLSGDAEATTGHAPSLETDLVDAPEPAHLVMAAGDATTAELIARVGRGLYVTRFHYLNGFLDPRRAVMTGLTRDGTFLIEDGQLGAPVRNARWTDSVLDAFSTARLIGVSRERTVHMCGWGGGQALVPALAMRAWKFD